MDYATFSNWSFVSCGLDRFSAEWVASIPPFWLVRLRLGTGQAAQVYIFLRPWSLGEMSWVYGLWNPLQIVICKMGPAAAENQDFIMTLPPSRSEDPSMAKALPSAYGFLRCNTVDTLLTHTHRWMAQATGLGCRRCAKNIFGKPLKKKSWMMLGWWKQDSCSNMQWTVAKTVVNPNCWKVYINLLAVVIFIIRVKIMSFGCFRGVLEVKRLKKAILTSHHGDHQQVN